MVTRRYLALAGALCALWLSGWPNGAHAEPESAREVDPLWPPDCTRDMPRDGLVLVDTRALETGDGEPQLRLSRSADGAPVAGSFEADAAPGGLRAWHAQAPLQPDTEYKIELTPSVGPNEARVSYFTTGQSFLAPLAFSAGPALRVLAREAPADAPGSEPVLLRIALPGLSGGLAQRPLRIVASLAEADGTTLTDRRSAQPGEAVVLELETQLEPEPRQLCIDVSAQGDLGETLHLEPAPCLSLPARARPPELEARTLEAPALDPADAEPDGEPEGAPHSSNGCNAAGDTPRAGAWLLLVLAAMWCRRQILPG